MTFPRSCLPSQFGFFKRKYQQLQREADDDGPSQPHVDEVL